MLQNLPTESSNHHTKTHVNEKCMHTHTHSHIHTKKNPDNNNNNARAHKRALTGK